MDLWKSVKSEKESIRSKLLNMSRRQWVTVLLLGILLAVAALPVSDKKRPDVSGIAKEGAEAVGEDSARTVLEKKLESLLSGVEGVGKVQAMLMTDEEKDAAGFYDSGTPKVTGVLITAEGADNSVVVRDIQQAVMALFQVEAHKIKVMKMK